MGESFNQQKHLNKDLSINLGSFYTPQILTQKAYELLQKHIHLTKDFVFLDNSCGYGDFFIKDLNYIAADIDKKALEILQEKNLKNLKIIHTNSLENLNRAKFSIKQNDNLIIIGNPPYNDRTSIIKAGLKKELFACDGNLKHRDLGISFLRSYDVLNPKFICVLHPLSYLIKQSNFKALNSFRQNYKLIDDLIISSQFFTPNSNTFFPYYHCPL